MRATNTMEPSVHRRGHSQVVERATEGGAGAAAVARRSAGRGVAREPGARNRGDRRCASREALCAVLSPGEIYLVDIAAAVVRHAPCRRGRPIQNDWSAPRNAARSMRADKPVLA